MKKIIIHGGCGAREDINASFYEYHENLIPIIQNSYHYLQKTNNATLTAVNTAKLLESNPIFNAGTGSKFQQDGQIRMSASVMDSISNKFAGVINIQDIEHPIEVALHLMSQDHSVLAGEQATTFAHKSMLLDKYNPMTEHRRQEYLALKKGLTGTIGVVVLDDMGNICAATSTGGSGFEIPGRVGDSPTVAGNFASKIMGVSCTGIGEEIINQAVAVKLHTRVLDGMSLQNATIKTIQESDNHNEYLGFIAIDHEGNIDYASTKLAQTLFAYHDGKECKSFYDLQNT